MLEYFRPKRVLDPMEGSGTTGDVCKELGIEYVGLDLMKGFNLLEDKLPMGFDFIFFHPPYWNIIKYSTNKDDLSNAKTYKDYKIKLLFCVTKLWLALASEGVLCILIGDVRKRGRIYMIFKDIIDLFGEVSEPIIIKVQHNITSSKWKYGGKFIPLAHEYVLIFKKN